MTFSDSFLAEPSDSDHPRANAVPPEQIHTSLATNRGLAGKTRALLAPTTPKEIKRRKALVAEIRTNRARRVVAPMTAADLVHEARAQEEASYDQRR
jgi:hypothetical protein